MHHSMGDGMNVDAFIDMMSTTIPISPLLLCVRVNNQSVLHSLQQEREAKFE